MRLQPNRFANDVDFVACAPSSINVLALARRVAEYNVPVLITGETGTGKECIAKYIHEHAFGSSAPYIGVNCAAIPENMLEAMLFGYEKGAFTGAVSAVKGKFELANGGTLLLDEIADMPLSLQVKLLRVLQEQEIERLGSNKKIELNIRLITATNKDLTWEIEKGNFRNDLFYRLSVIPIHIAPLRERKEDIMPLIECFIRKYNTYTNHSCVLSEEAKQLLQSYSWPGNVRELENVIQRGIIMCNDGIIHGSDLNIVIARDVHQTITKEKKNLSDSTLFNETKRALKQKGRQAEYQYIIDLLEYHRGNKSKTAEDLGITTRALRYRLASMREHGFDVECYLRV